MAVKHNLQIKKRKDMVAWDAISDCEMERCPAADMCPYMKPITPCRIQKEYIEAFLAIVKSSLSEVMDEPLKFRMGMHLVPLYKGLCRMKIAELGAGDVVRTNDKGGLFVHPIYKEIRQQVDTIEKVWKNLGISELFFGAIPEVGDLMNAGGDDYYAQMAQDAEMDDMTPEAKEEMEAILARERKPVLMLRTDYIRKRMS